MGLNDLPKFVPLEEATTRHNINPQVLDRAVKDNVIHAVRIGEEVLVNDHDVAIVAIQTREPDPNDELISINEAARRLKLPVKTVSRWQERGWLPMQATGPGRAKLVSWTRAKALDELRQSCGRRHLIPRSKYFSRQVIYGVGNVWT